jgi:hypothetical protein
MSVELSGWRKRQIALDQKAENARELGLDYEPDKTIEMAREAGFMAFEYPALIDKEDLKKLEAFAALVRADERNKTWTSDRWTEYERSIAATEREACVKECKKLIKVFLSSKYSAGQPFSSFKERHAVAACIEAIQARGQA